MNEFDQVKAYLSYVRKEKGRSAWTYLAAKTGNDQSWFRKFFNGGISDPRYFQLRRVLNFAESSGWTYQPDQNDS